MFACQNIILNVYNSQKVIIPLIHFLIFSYLTKHIIYCYWSVHLHSAETSFFFFLSFPFFVNFVFGQNYTIFILFLFYSLNESSSDQITHLSLLKFPTKIYVTLLFTVVYIYLITRKNIIYLFFDCSSIFHSYQK